MPEEVRRGEVDELKGFQEITCNIVFDVKMRFTRNARYVANGSMNDTLVVLCYLGVVSRDSFIIAFLVAALNDLDILACDMSNAYLNAPCREIIWFVAGLDFGKSLEGKVMKLVRALYGLKISGVSWRKMFEDHIVNCLRITPSTIDSNMYYQRNTNEDGTDYYKLLLVYVDNVLACIHDAKEVMTGIAEKFEINNDEIAEPKLYLGGNIENFQLPNGNHA